MTLHVSNNSQVTVQSFISKLANTPTMPDVANQYDFSNPHNAARRNNLQRYLEQMAELQPTTVLVGEAPGYRGMRLTGVTFSSRAIIRDGVPGLPLFGEANGYIVPLDEDNPAQKEQTATIVWGVLKDIRPLPLNWCAFPFHPHQPGKLLSNRKPRRPETEIGKAFLQDILTMFDIKSVIAMGNVAADSLTDMNIPYQKVRHAAQGGKNDFVAGMQALFRKNK